MTYNQSFYETTVSLCKIKCTYAKLYYGIPGGDTLFLMSLQKKTFDGILGLCYYDPTVLLKSQCVWISEPSEELVSVLKEYASICKKPIYNERFWEMLYVQTNACDWLPVPKNEVLAELKRKNKKSKIALAISAISLLA